MVAGRFNPYCFDTSVLQLWSLSFTCSKKNSMPYRCFQLMLPFGVGYTLVLLSIWNTLLVVGSLIFSRLQAIEGVRNATNNRDQFRVFAGSGMTNTFVGVGVPVRFKLITLLKYPPVELPHLSNGIQTVDFKSPKNAVPNAFEKNMLSGSEDKICKLNMELSDHCMSLINGSESKPPVKDVRIPNPECTLGNLLKNCSRFRYAHGYEDKVVTSEELDYPLAFAIKMHTSPEQAEQLLRAIYRPHNVYCIHVDKKAEKGVFETMKYISSCLDNVIVPDDRETVVYMSSAAVRAELTCMRTVMASSFRWKYYINLAGQEFPLRTNLEMVMMLKRLHGANDIESYDHPRFQEWRFKKKFEIKNGRLEQTNVDKQPFGHRMQLSKGSAYGMFKREFVNFILTDDVARKFINWLNDTSSPDENVWATLNTLPWAPGGSYVETRQTFNTHASRAVIWNWNKDVCHGQFIRSVCVFGAGDLKWLTSRPNVIANKFNNDLDPVPITCLESWLHRRVSHPLLQTVDMRYMANLPHVKYYDKLDLTKLSPKYRKESKQKWLKKHPWVVW